MVNIYDTKADGEKLDYTWYNDMQEAHGGVNTVGSYPQITATFVILKVAAMYYARNGLTGKIPYSGAVASTVIQAAVDAIHVLGEGILFFAEGHYYPVTPIVLYSAITLDLGQAIFHWDEADALFKAVGTEGAVENLTVNGLEHDTVLNVVDASTFSADDYVLIHSDQDDGVVGYCDGEIHIVESVNVPGNTITMHGGLDNDYLLADVGRVTLLSMVENLKIYDGLLEGISATQNKAVFGASFRYVAKFEVIGLHSKNIAETGVQIQSCFLGEVSLCDIYGSVRPGLGYAIRIENASSHIDVHANIFTYCRHSFTIGSGGVTYDGNPRYINIHNNISSASTSTAFDVHEHRRAEHIVFNGNIVTSGSSGFNVGAVDCEIIGNIIRVDTGVGGAILDRGDVLERIIIKNNIVIYAPTAVLLDSTALELIDVSDLYAEAEQRIFYADGNAADQLIVNIDNVVSLDVTTNYDKIYVCNAPKYVNIKNCIISHAFRSGVNIIGASGGLITNNDIYNNNQRDIAHYAVQLEDCTNINVKDNRLFDDQMVPTQRCGVVEVGTSDNNVIKDNWYSGNVDSPVIILGAGTVLNSRQFQFIQGSTFIDADGNAKGWEINAEADIATALGQLPLEVQQVVRIKIWAIALGAPVGGGGQMHLDVLFDCGGSLEDWNLAANTWTLANFDSEEADYANNKVIHWVIEDGDVGNELLNLLGGDSFTVKINGGTAAAPDGATNATFRIVEIEHV